MAPPQALRKSSRLHFAQERPALPLMHRALRFQELGLIAVIAVIAVLLTVFGGEMTGADGREVSRFLRADNLVQVAKSTSFIAVMAVGATLVILSGGIDLSVGSIYALSAMAGAMTLHRFGPLGPGGEVAGLSPVAAGVLACLAVGALCGAVNGMLVVGLRVHPFIVTLGTMAAFRGVAFVMPGWFAAEGELAVGQTISDFPEAFTDGFIRREMFFGKGLYPVPMFLMIAVAAAGAFVLHKTVFGRRLFALGSNEQAARLCGVPAALTKILVYTASGLTCGIAAVIFLGYYGAASSDAGTGYELAVIASAVVGGASLAGGRGSAMGALLGALVLQLISNAIIILNIDQNYSLVITGAVIVAAVVLDKLNGALIERSFRSRTPGSTPPPSGSETPHESEAAARV